MKSISWPFQKNVWECFDTNPQWPDLYYRQIIRLGRAWAKNDSSSDNPSVYKHRQADIIRLDELPTTIRLKRQTIAIARLDR